MGEKKIDARRNKITIFFCSACFLLFVAILILVMVSGAIRDIEIFENANFVEVEATIVEYKEYIVDTGYPVWSTFYEYKSPNGGIYTGCWDGRIRTEEEAKAQIGMKVPLYIDDELNLQTKSLKVDKTGVIVGGVFGSICLLGSIGFFTYLAIQLAHWLKEQARMKGVNYKEDNVISRPKNFVFFHQIIMLFTIFAIVGCIGSSISKENTYQKYINAEFVEVVGVIYEYKEFEKDDAPYYVIYYKYVSADGEEYAGMWQNDIYSKDDAEAAIGSEVPLLYDKEYGVIKSMSDLEPVQKPDHTLNIILAVVFVVLFVNSLVRFIRFIIRNERYEARQKMQGKTIE
ncbi:MAG: hypothetical protein K2K85_00345 [Clostridia bacterium]|nr:hypothetical protein [Clostridia bacterium]